MIKGVIFDLGHTLIRLTRDMEIVAREGAEAMANWYFKNRHIRIDAAALVETFLAERAAGRQIAEQTQTEVPVRQSLHNTLHKIDAPSPAFALVAAAIKEYFGAEEAAWQPYPDAVDTVKRLKTEGYRLGLYSNATDDPLIQRLINRNGLRPWLSPTFSSAGWGWCKPKPEPFKLIASRWGLPPDRIVVVGDTLKADILGAQNAGMYSILVTRDENLSNADNRHIQPTAVADSLSAVPGIIAQL